LRHWRVCFWLAVAAGVVLALWPMPQGSAPWFPAADKVQHALAFAVLVVLGRRGGYRSVPALAIGLLVLGGAIEVAQSFTATRTAEWLDWLADAVGIALGFGVWARVAALRGDSSGLEQEHGR
jgi:VanZ family protein